MKKLIIAGIAALIVISPTVYAEDDSSKEVHNTSIVDSGTYKVTAFRVDPEEKEIYVKTSDGKILELYFKKETKLTKAGKEVPFTTLKKDQKLEINVEKAGKHLKPLSVTILE